MADTEEIFRIYDIARKMMKAHNNPDQWGDYRPEQNVILSDIDSGNLYVIEQDGQIRGIFAFIIGIEPTYQHIDGEWLNHEQYGTIHRVASDGKARGIMQVCLDYCWSILKNIRIDTHHDNKIMQHILEKEGFQRCGIIYVEDGSERIAYQKTIFS